MEELNETPPQSLVYEHMKSCERERQEQVFYIEQREDIVKHTSKALKLALFEKEEAIAKHARAENTAAFALAEYKRAQDNLVGYDERVAQSKERWEECVKFRMFNEDGECTLSWVTLEMIFSCTWNPRKQKCVRVSHRFQCVCRGFRKATQSYLRDHASYYINFVPRSDTIRIYARGFGKEANTQLRFSESNNANELTDTMWNLNLGDWTGFESVVYETTEPEEYAIVLRKWPMDIGNVYILGGKYTPNEHGRICDWRCTPLTKMHMDKWDRQLDLSHGAQNVCEFVSTLTLQGAECIPYSKREAGEPYNTSRVIVKVDMSVPTFVAVE